MDSKNEAIETTPEVNPPGGAEAGEISGGEVKGEAVTPAAVPSAGNGDTVEIPTNELTHLRDTLKELRGVIETQSKIIDKYNQLEVEKLREEITQIKSSLPSITTDKKATFTGYYDIDAKTGELLSQMSKDEYAKASEQLKQLRSYLK